MQFTREPIIETIITPKDGYRLVLRPSKGGGEEFFVDMVEVVTFGHATLYRSLDKPKSFIVPIADYDVVEVREARMAIKSAAAVEKVKIAGGKKEEEEKSEKKGGRKRARKRKPSDEQQAPRAEESPKQEVPKQEAEPRVQPPREPRPLIPPPPTLISESMAKAKEEASPVEVADE